MHNGPVSELLIMIPFVAVMTIGTFRLDVSMFAPKVTAEQARRKSRRPICGVDEAGRLILTDPDGNVYRPGRDERRAR